MTIQMRHCVRAAQRGDKIAAEELIKAFKPYLHHQAGVSRVLCKSIQ